MLKASASATCSFGFTVPAKLNWIAIPLYQSVFRYHPDWVKVGSGDGHLIGCFDIKFDALAFSTTGLGFTVGATDNHARPTVDVYICLVLATLNSATSDRVIG